MLAAEVFKLISKSVIVPSWVYKDRTVENKDYSFPSSVYQVTYSFLRWLMLKSFLLARRIWKRKIKHDKKIFSTDNNFKLNHIKFNKSLSEKNRDENQLNIEELFKEDVSEVLVTVDSAGSVWAIFTWTFQLNTSKRM